MEGIDGQARSQAPLLHRIPSDEDIPAIDVTAATTPPPLQGPLTRARARQLNQQVLSFLQATPNIHENMMLPKVDVFISLRNDGPQGRS